METEAARPISNHGASSGNRSTCARSFDCTFCKRGFSNAQALGGHMNMHRKDKAKLKQPSWGCQFPFDVSENNAAGAVISYSSPVVVNTKRPRQVYGSQAESSVCIPVSWPCRISAEEELPLFGERASWGGDEEEIKMGHGEEEAELDLELRLGRSEIYLRSEDRNQEASLMRKIC
ncbi:hypothetical protein Cni_G13489 [Canna indica]|uniref:C2H2-type domain-containing protein n=1 Tax=Canna indica TaxID=4628 RepID=A0AAQ3KAB8_9LILI|nr:hypothetical protein Cni_G13489 [Canna indica]